MAKLVVCAWCGKIKQVGSLPTSHGICEECAKKVMEEYENDRSKMSQGQKTVSTKPI